MKPIALIFILTTLLANSALAGKEAGNGGNGLLIGGTPYVLDLVEAGVEKAPYFSQGTIDPAIRSKIAVYLKQFPEIINPLSSKLTEVEAISPIMAWSLVEAFRFFNIRVVDDALVNIHDDDSVVDYDPANLVQLAIRRGASIFLSGKWWPQLKVEQKVALMVHEIIYSFQNVKEVRHFVGYKANGEPHFEWSDGQESSGARAITGFLFSPDFSESTAPEKLARLLENESRLGILSGDSDWKVISIKQTTLSTAFNVDRISLYWTDSREGTVPTRMGFISRSSSEKDLTSICLNVIKNAPHWHSDVVGSPWDIHYFGAYNTLITLDQNPTFGLKLVRYQSKPNLDNFISYEYYTGSGQDVAYYIITGNDAGYMTHCMRQMRAQKKAL
jgi:hypothetical protein